MRSHTYQFTGRQLAGVMLPTLAALGLLALLLKAGVAWNWLPAPSAILNPDRVVLAHQAAAAHSHWPAQIILLGDSTCLMGVDGAQLQRQLPGHPDVLNLALFIWLGLDTYGDALADYAKANPGVVRAVVLLVSPTKLLGSTSTPYAQRLWRQVQPGQAQPAPRGMASGLAEWLGARALRRRLLSRALETPLHGSGAAFFGFDSLIDRYMTAHHGSLVEFGVLHSQVAAHFTPWRLAPALEPETRSLRADVPPGTRLLVGLTPGPQVPGGISYSRAYSTLLGEWERWLKADVLLTNLPPALPEAYFSPSGHLNQAGQARFTAELARQLASLLRSRRRAQALSTVAPAAGRETKSVGLILVRAWYSDSRR